MKSDKTIIIKYTMGKKSKAGGAVIATAIIGGLLWGGKMLFDSV